MLMQLIGVSNWSMTSLIRLHNVAEIAKICRPIVILTENSFLRAFIWSGLPCFPPGAPVGFKNVDTEKQMEDREKRCES